MWVRRRRPLWRWDPSNRRRAWGSTPGLGCVLSRAFRNVLRSFADGRACGSLDSVAATSSVMPARKPAQIGLPFMMRYATALESPAAERRPAGAGARDAQPPAEDVAGPLGAARRRAFPGSSTARDPTATPVWVRPVEPSCLAMPKSMSFGPLQASTTFAGFRSRWIRPTSCSAATASARSAASPRRRSAGTGPLASTACASVAPSTYSVAIHSGGSSVSAATSFDHVRAVHQPGQRSPRGRTGPGTPCPRPETAAAPSGRQGRCRGRRRGTRRPCRPSRAGPGGGRGRSSAGRRAAAVPEPTQPPSHPSPDTRPYHRQSPGLEYAACRRDRHAYDV